MSDPPPATSVNQPNRIQKSQPEDTDVTAQHPLDAPRPTGCESETAISTATPSPLRDVDPQIIEALRGKDRIYVLKLGELMESLINDERRQRIELTPATSYQRLLVHRCSAYYKLTPEIDSMSKMIYVYSTEESRVPSLRISELVPPETTAAPAFKIMRRSSTDRRNKPPQAGSVTGEDGDLSDLEPSETGSLGGRSNTTGGSTKKHMTIEEREAAYNEARSRIFMGFEEKEKAKDKDINSSSSSLSVTSGSTKNGGSSAGDADSSSSSPATESEWSGPVRRGERRQNSGYASASSSTRSIRSSAYISNGSGSSRNSRAASPSSFQYPSLYEPTAPSMPLYDHSQQHSAPPAPIYHSPYGYPPYNQGQPNPPYMPYPAYYPPPYPPYSSPPRLPQTASDSATASSREPYVPPPPMPYSPGYMWPQPVQPPVQSPPMQPQPVPPQPPSNVPHAMSSPPPGQPPYPSYIPQPPPHPYTYSMPGYYPNQPGHPMPPPPPQPVHPSLVPVPQPFDPRANGSGPGNNQANCFRNSVPTNNPLPPNSNRPPQQRNGLNNGPVKGTGPKPRGGVTQPVRAPWSYGPGVGSGGMITMNTMNLPLTNETVGPRLSNSRRQTNMSNSSNGRSTSGDDGSSVAVGLSSILSRFMNLTTMVHFAVISVVLISKDPDSERYRITAPSTCTAGLGDQPQASK
ncbi:cAMP-regulated phosphoprotein 21 [Leucoagaricus sp. SymC.cos]|nr:cAMP-regulated phosphoprotein 21 [Leucoagaricus sp. SymC.cos]